MYFPPSGWQLCHGLDPASSQIASHSPPQRDREGGGEGKTGVRKLMKQQENIEITSWSLSQQTCLGRNDTIHCQLSFLPIQFVNLISGSGSGKQNQGPFLFSPQVQLPLFSKAMSGMEGLQSGHRRFSLQLLLILAVLPGCSSTGTTQI